MSAGKDKTEAGTVFGESVSARKVNNALVFKNRPKRKSPTVTEKAAPARDRFAKAIIYGKNLTDETKEFYKKGVNSKMRSVYMVAMSDYLNPPTVGPINLIDYEGAVGNPIVVTAIDDFMVTRVVVTVTSADGTRLEKGDATQAIEQTFLWTYKATVANPVLAGTKITAMAYDRADNITTFEVVL